MATSESSSKKQQIALEPLSASDMVNPHVARIGVVGHSRAGKSTVLAVLKMAFGREGWTAEVRGDEKAAQTGSGGKSLKDPGAYLEYLKAFVTGGFFPPRTRVQETTDRVLLQVNRDKKPMFALECFDPAGEVLERDYGQDSPESRQLALIQQSLSKCTGILLLLDPDTAPDLWLKTWGKATDRLAISTIRGGKGPRVAICFTKADTGIWQRRYRVRDAEEWVKSQLKGRSKLFDEMQNTKLETRWFFVSATGWTDGVPNIRTMVDSRKIKRTGTNENLLRLRELVPDPAQRESDLRTIDDVRQYRYMESLPIFVDPLRIKAHDFSKFPVTEEGVTNKFGLTSSENRVSGVHFGYGRNIEGEDASVQPWNIVEPVIWLADLAAGAGK